MFFTGSRYENAGTTTVTRADGTVVTVTKLPLPATTPVRGYYRRPAGQRLDLIASYFLADPTAFWRLANADNVVVPDALAARDLVGIPS